MDRFKFKLSENYESLFDEIWREYYSKLVIFLKSSFKIFNAEDAVQEIMVKVFTNISKYNSNYSFNTWIYTVARNHAIDVIRKEKKVLQTITAAGCDAESLAFFSLETPESIFLNNELNTDIAGFIEGLPESEREISFLKFYEGLKYSQISRVTGVPVGTVKYHVHNIKRKFADFYEARYEN